MTTTEVDTAAAETYERKLVPSLFAGWASSLLQLVVPTAGASVLDLACGTGIVARSAARTVGANARVVGVDIDEAMVGVADAVSRGIEPRIAWLLADARRLPFPDDSFDVVVCQQALQFLVHADVDVVLCEMRRVLAADGRAAASVWRGVQQGPCARAVARTLGRYVGDAAEQVGRPCEAADVDALATRTAAAGFSTVRTGIMVESLRSPSAQGLFEQAVLLSSLAPALAALGPKARSSLVDDLEGALRPHMVEGEFAIPIEATVVLAHGDGTEGRTRTKVRG